MRILLAEDYDSFREMAEAGLAVRGHEVTKVVINGNDAWDALDAGEPWDAVVTDWDLGFGPNGRAIAEYALGLDVPLVVLWSSIDRSYDLRGDPILEDPRFHVLEKPFMDDEPLDRVAALLTQTEGAL